MQSKLAHDVSVQARVWPIPVAHVISWFTVAPEQVRTTNRP